MKIIIITAVLILLTGCNHGSMDNQGKNFSQSPAPTISPDVQNESHTPKPGDIIGTYSTALVDKKKERVHNINLALKSLEDVSLEPGEVFSFNDVVGERSERTGYQKAYIFIGEEKTLGYGGGVCQISSTLYNAAMAAGLEIIERHRHEKKVDYVPEDKDATVSYGSFDLKFKNTMPYPVTIRVTLNDDVIIADIIRR